MVAIGIELALKEMINVIHDDSARRIKMQMIFIHAPKDFRERLTLLGQVEANQQYGCSLLGFFGGF